MLADELIKELKEIEKDINLLYEKEPIHILIRKRETLYLVTRLLEEIQTANLSRLIEKKPKSSKQLKLEELSEFFYSLQCWTILLIFTSGLEFTYQENIQILLLIAWILFFCIQHVISWKLNKFNKTPLGWLIVTIKSSASYLSKTIYDCVKKLQKK